MQPISSGANVQIRLGVGLTCLEECVYGREVKIKRNSEAYFVRNELPE